MTAKRWGFALALLLVRLQEVKLAETKPQGHAMCALAVISFAGARQRLAARAILFREVADLDRLLKPEVESCFRRDADLLALGGCLNRGARGGAHAGPDRRALAATGNRADGRADSRATANCRSEEHTSELQSRLHLVCRLLLEKKKNRNLQLEHTGLRRTQAVDLR